MQPKRQTSCNVPDSNESRIRTYYFTTIFYGISEDIFFSSLFHSFSSLLHFEVSIVSFNVCSKLTKRFDTPSEWQYNGDDVFTFTDVPELFGGFLLLPRKTHIRIGKRHRQCQCDEHNQSSAFACEVGNLSYCFTQAKSKNHKISARP